MGQRVSVAARDEEYPSICYERSLELLRHNATPYGPLAASPTKRASRRRYTSIFGRDAAICALGMAACGEKNLHETALAGLRTLARFQAENGQIPKYVQPDTEEADFWYSGCIDASLWWLIAVKWCDRLIPGAGLEQELADQIQRTLRWLACQEHPVWRLLQQNEASDWADIMPRSGFVLYTNALWYWVKKLYRLPEAKQTRDYANQFYYPFGNAVPEQRRARLLVHYIRNKIRPGDFLLSFVNFSFWGEEIDLFGNILAALTGLVDTSRAGRIVEGLRALGADRPYPVRVVGLPIERESTLWRPYMERHRQNLPYQYHNGGIWPFVGGFWVMLLKKLGLDGEAWGGLQQLAAVNRVGGWEFNEWFHGRSGAPMGMPGQSWNAATFLLAHEMMNEQTRIF